MSLTDIALTIVVISIFCLGIRVLLSEGMIFNFIRRPFEYEKDSKMMNYFRERYRRYVLVSTEDAYAVKKRYIKLSDRIGFILKPFMLCVVCFPSVWGSSLFICLHGLKWELIICIVSSTLLIKVINDKVDW